MALLNKIRTRHGRSPVTPDVLAAADQAVLDAHDAQPGAEQALADKKQRRRDRAARVHDLEVKLKNQRRARLEPEVIMATERELDEATRAVAIDHQNAMGGPEEHRVAHLRNQELQARYQAMKLHRSVLADEIDPLLQQIADLADQVQAHIDAHPARSDAHPLYDDLTGAAYTRMGALADVSTAAAAIRGVWAEHRDRVHEIAADVVNRT